MLCQRKVSLLLLSSDIRQTEAKRLAQLAGEEMKKDEKSTQKNGYDQNWHFEYEIMAVFIIINIITINLLGFFFKWPSKLQQMVQFYTDMDPASRQILQEKEQAVMALQETVEVCACAHTHTHIHNHTLKCGKHSLDW